MSKYLIVGDADKIQDLLFRSSKLSEISGGSAESIPGEGGEMPSGGAAGSLNMELESYQLINPNDFIWKDYLQSDLPILIVTGDHFMFNLYSDKYQREFSIRDVTINSQEDLDVFKKEFNEPEIQETPEPYFPYHSILIFL